MGNLFSLDQQRLYYLYSCLNNCLYAHLSITYILDFYHAQDTYRDLSAERFKQEIQCPAFQRSGKAGKQLGLIPLHSLDTISLFFNVSSVFRKF